MERTVFNKAQLEMLDIMANIRSDEELDALKHAVSEFYARRADEEMEKLWQSGKWTEPIVWCRCCRYTARTVQHGRHFVMESMNCV